MRRANRQVVRKERRASFMVTGHTKGHTGLQFDIPRACVEHTKQKERKKGNESRREKKRE